MAGALAAGAGAGLAEDDALLDDVLLLLLEEDEPESELLEAPSFLVEL